MKELKSKILHIAEPFATGVLSFLLDITKHQVEEYEIYILYGIRPLTPPDVEQLFDSRINLIKMKSFKGALGTVLNPKAYKEVLHWYKEIKPDIVHFHSSASGFVGRWTLPCGRIKSFYTPHGYSFLMQDNSKIKSFIYWLIEYISAKRPTKTIACSKGEYEEAIKLSKNSTYINNGINTKELLPYSNSFKGFHSPIKICTSGRIMYQKNPFLFNKIASLLPNIEFIWIGEGNLKSELIAPNIKITGWIPREEALNIIKEADFFILPSLWEGLPISLLEAMFLKKICLVSNVIGNRDVINHKKNGMICNTAEEYVQSIIDIIQGKINGFELGQYASKDVLEMYNVDIMASKYSEIYNN